MVRLDKDEDGKLIKDEVPAGVWHRLLRFDANEDGTISKRELRRGSKAGHGPNGGRAAGRPARDPAVSRGRHGPMPDDNGEAN